MNLLDKFRSLNLNLVLDVEVTINGKVIKQISSAEYRNSLDYIQELKIKFSTYSKNINVKVGDRVIYKRGYKNDKLYTRFIGYVDEITQNEIVCYDELHYIGKQDCNIKEWKGTQVNTTVQDNGTTYNVVDLNKDILLSQLFFDLMKDRDAAPIQNKMTPSILNVDLKTDTAYSHIQGGIRKQILLNSLFKNLALYISYDEADTTYINLTDRYIIDKTQKTIIDDTIMVSDNTSKPILDNTAIRVNITNSTPSGSVSNTFYYAGRDRTQIELTENVDISSIANQFFDLFFSNVLYIDVLSQIETKWDELNNRFFSGDFTLTGLPFVSVSEIITFMGKPVKVYEIYEVVDLRTIRQEVWIT